MGTVYEQTYYYLAKTRINSDLKYPRSSEQFAWDNAMLGSCVEFDYGFCVEFDSYPTFTALVGYW